VKKIFALILALAMVFALAACGETKTAEVVENVDPGNNSVVIETPPAIVSGPDTPADQYPSVSALPTTAPTTAPNGEAAPVPVPTTTTAPDGSTITVPGTGDGTGTPELVDPVADDVTYADDSGKDYEATVTQQERNGAWTAYISGEWVNFRVGPGTEYKIYESLPRGTAVRVVGYTDNGWAKVLYNDLVGFVARNYLSANAPAPETVIIITEAPATTTPSPAPSVVPVSPAADD